MKYIITFKAKRKNARRHILTQYGRPQYFNSIEEAKAYPAYNNPHYITDILTANYKPIDN